MANNVDYSKNSPNYTANANVRAAYGYPRSIDWITIHWWGDPNTNPTYEGVISWFSQTRSQVSAHDVITGTGSRVAVMVDYNNAAWHAGNAQGNATSLGFECDPRCRDEDYEAVAQDVAETWRYYGREIPLRPHKSWQATACPGNYDLNRIANRAREINNPQPAKVTASADQVKQAYRDILEREVDEGGLHTFTTNGMSNEEVRGALMASQERKDLEARKAAEAAEAAKPEWIRNLKDITDVKLSVLPASGTKVINLLTLQPVNDVTIPKGTQIDIAKETTLGGVKYLISNYSANGNIANGIKASDLGVPVVVPVEEKPEWLKNLIDIEDKDFWTRSETPVLNIVDGTVTRRLPINTKVRITHATELVGKDLLVLEGQKEVIETLYLSDTEIKNPDTDLEQRVSVLEKIVAAVVQFLSNLFKNFKP